MKKFTLLLLGLLLSATILWSQTPNEFNYQAVARTSAGLIMEDQNISVEISIMESGSAVYTEEHAVTTNQFGLFTLSIGDGTATLGDFATVDWTSGSYGVQVAMDENAGTTFVVMGTSPLLTVPFAMHAKTAENTFSGNYGDLTNTPDLSNYDTDASDDFSGNYSDLNGTPTIPSNTSDLTNDAGFVTEDTNTQLTETEVDSYVSDNGYLTSFTEVDGNITNEIQDLTFTGTTLSIENGNSVDLSALQDGFEADTDTQLSESEVDAMVSDNGYLTSFSEVDSSTTNELQDLTISGTTLSIENGNNVDLSGVQDGTGTDNQTLSFYSGTMLAIQNGNAVNLASLQDGYEANTDAQTLSLSGSTLTISTGNNVDLSSLSGSGAEKINDLSDAKSDADGSENGSSIFFGVNAGGNDNRTDNRNIGIGYNVLATTIYGSNNTVTGYNSGTAIAAGDDNTVYGYNSGVSITNGDKNTLTGSESGASITTAIGNVFTGYKSGSNMLGGYNVALGYYAGRQSTTAASQYNVLIGSQSGYKNSGSSNVGIGYKSLYGNTGENNVAIGARSGSCDAPGSNNVFIGYTAGNQETTSNKLIIANNYGGTEATSRVDALVFGDFSAKTLDLNAEVKINQAYTLPSTNGTTDQVLTTDGSGLTSWETLPKTKLTNMLSSISTDDEYSVIGVDHNWTEMTGGVGSISVNKVHGTETTLEIEIMTTVKFRFYDVGNYVTIRVRLSDGTQADYGMDEVRIWRNTDITWQSDQVQFKLYFTNLTAGTKSIKFEILSNTGSDGDVEISINEAYLSNGIVAKEFMTE